MLLCLLLRTVYHNFTSLLIYGCVRSISLRSEVTAKLVLITVFTVQSHCSFKVPNLRAATLPEGRSIHLRGPQMINAAGKKENTKWNHMSALEEKRNLCCNHEQFISNFAAGSIFMFNRYKSGIHVLMFVGKQIIHFLKCTHIVKRDNMCPKRFFVFFSATPKTFIEPKQLNLQ